MNNRTGTDYRENILNSSTDSLIQSLQPCTIDAGTEDSFVPICRKPGRRWSFPQLDPPALSLPLSLVVVILSGLVQFSSCSATAYSSAAKPALVIPGNSAKQVAKQRIEPQRVVIKSGDESQRLVVEPSGKVSGSPKKSPEQPAEAGKKQQYKSSSSLSVDRVTRSPLHPSTGSDRTRVTAAAMRAGNDKNNKITLMSFGAAWCMPCKIMAQTTLKDPEIQRYLARHYVFQKVDIDDFEGFNLKEQFKVQKLPTFIFLDASGKIMGRYERSLSTAEMKALLERHRTPGRE